MASSNPRTHEYVVHEEKPNTPPTGKRRERYDSEEAGKDLDDTLTARDKAIDEMHTIDKKNIERALQYVQEILVGTVSMYETLQYGNFTVQKLELIKVSVIDVIDKYSSWLEGRDFNANGRKLLLGIMAAKYPPILGFEQRRTNGKYTEFKTSLIQELADRRTGKEVDTHFDTYETLLENESTIEKGFKLFVEHTLPLARLLKSFGEHAVVALQDARGADYNYYKAFLTWDAPTKQFLFDNIILNVPDDSPQKTKVVHNVKEGIQLSILRSKAAIALYILLLLGYLGYRYRPTQEHSKELTTVIEVNGNQYTLYDISDQLYISLMNRSILDNPDSLFMYARNNPGNFTEQDKKVFTVWQKTVKKLEYGNLSEPEKLLFIDRLQGVREAKGYQDLILQASESQ